MEKLNRAQKCSILGPQNLESRPPGPPWIRTWYLMSSETRSSAYDHIWLNAPVLVRSLKLSNHQLGDRLGIPSVVGSYALFI